MNSTSARSVTFVLFAGIAFNCFWFLPNALFAVRSFRETVSMPNNQRRLVQRGAWYLAILKIEDQIPKQASVRLVSTAPPWYLSYFLYPRLLRQGSSNSKDLKKIRQRYPHEWVLFYSEDKHPEMTAYPPIARKRR